MISKIISAIPYGFGGKIVEVEGDMNRGLPAFNIVGMANKTINEAKERVRSALSNSDFTFPDRKVTINLAPAELTKDGSHLDLAIALSVLVLSGQLTKMDVRNKLFAGELSLDGRVRPVRGIINIVEAAKTAGVREVYVPVQNLAQAALIRGVKVYGVDTLTGLFLTLKAQQELPEAITTTFPAKQPREAAQTLLSHIHGQATAKRAIQIAIAGHHNVLLSGPPGSGKTMLARVAANLLPDLSEKEIIEVTKIHSIAGTSADEVVTARPFRNPHHTASASAIIGGGAKAIPGEISLAHGGVLFLDEIPEFQRNVLESLRQPLEDKVVSISRANRKTTFPADFILIATMNPCPCGYLGDPTHECKCTEVQIQNYQKRLSGPLLDRIDIYVSVEKVKNSELVVKTTTNSREHDVVKNTITGAVARQAARFGTNGVYNGSLSSFQVTKLLKMAPEAEKLLNQASEKLDLSARSYFKTIKVAQTIADLDNSPIIQAKHLAEALTFRKR